MGLVTGDSANDLFGVTLDPNVLIQESKVTTCDIRPGRRPHGPELVTLVDGYRQRAGVTVETGTHLATVGNLQQRVHLQPDAHGPWPGHRAGTDGGDPDRSGTDGGDPEGSGS